LIPPPSPISTTCVLFFVPTSTQFLWPSNSPLPPELLLRYRQAFPFPSRRGGTAFFFFLLLFCVFLLHPGKEKKTPPSPFCALHSPSFSPFFFPPLVICINWEFLCPPDCEKRPILLFMGVKRLISFPLSLRKFPFFPRLSTIVFSPSPPPQVNSAFFPFFGKRLFSLGIRAIFHPPDPHDPLCSHQFLPPSFYKL